MSRPGEATHFFQYKNNNEIGPRILGRVVPIDGVQYFLPSSELSPIPYGLTKVEVHGKNYYAFASCKYVHVISTDSDSDTDDGEGDLCYSVEGLKIGGKKSNKRRTKSKKTRTRKHKKKSKKNKTKGRKKLIRR